MNEKQSSPLTRLIEASNELIADTMPLVARDNPKGHAAAMLFLEAGAVPNLIIESRSDVIIVGLSLIDEDNGDLVKVFEQRAARVHNHH